MINKKCMELLIFLYEQKDYSTFDELSQKFKISRRGIRYRIENVNDFLVEKGCLPIDKQHGRGVRLVKTEKLEGMLSRFRSTYTPKNYTFSKEERKSFIKSELLQSEEPILISYLMSVMGVSKNTVLKELDAIVPFLADYHLTLVRKPKVGIYVEGKECDKRSALSKVNSEMMTVEDLFNYISTGKANSKINYMQFDSLFSDIRVEKLDEILKEVQRELGYEFSDTAYGNLITHIVIMMKRVQVNQQIVLMDTGLDEKKYSKEITIARKMVQRIADNFDMLIPDEEAHYLTLHILSAKVMGGRRGDEEKNLENNVGRMISLVENSYSLKFEPDIYKTLLDGLMLHLRPALNRIRFGLKIENPIFEEIMASYTNLFKETKRACRVLEAFLNKEISDQEVSYIMLHFGAALRNVEKGNKALRVILVCASGIGTANMLKSQLERYYHVDIIDVIGVRKVTDYPKESYDLIISNIVIPRVEVERYIHVNALLLEEDYKRLDRRLLKRKEEETRRPMDLVKLSKVMAVIEKNTVVHNEQRLKNELTELLLTWQKGF